MTHTIDLQREFDALAAQWRKETIFESSLTKISASENLQKIIDLGPSVLPYIFEDLKRNGGMWFSALRILTGVNPVHPEDVGNIQVLTQKWLKWATESSNLTSVR